MTPLNFETSNDLSNTNAKHDELENNFTENKFFFYFSAMTSSMSSANSMPIKLYNARTLGGEIQWLVLVRGISSGDLRRKATMGIDPKGGGQF